MSYYDSCPIPKPAKSRKKKLCNGYKEKSKRYCYYCGTSGADRHEVFRGVNRQISIKETFQVDLCLACHKEVTLNTEKGKKINEFWAKKYQREYMDRLINNGMSEEDALSVWMDPKFIGKNFLEECEPK